MNLAENSNTAPEEIPNNPLDVLHTAFADVLHTETLPESAEWQRIIQAAGGKFFADTIKKGRAAHIPDILVRRFAFEILTKCLERQDYGSIARYLQGWNMGHAEEQSYFEELARAQQKGMAEKEAAKPQVRQRHYLLLSPDATIADLVQELESDKVAEDVNDLLFSELTDNISTGIGRKLITLMHTPEATTTKVTDFFGCDPENLATYLPIKFRKNR